MFSSSKGKGKEGRSSGESHRSSRVASGSPGSSDQSKPPTGEEIQYAITTISWALETLGVPKFGFIGGGAVSILSSHYGLRPRKTDDVDVLVQPTSTGMGAYEVSQALTTNEALKGYFVARDDNYEKDKPHVVVTRKNGSKLIPIEIFDWQSWPRREQYYNLDRDENSIQYFPLPNRQAPLLNPGWLLRQKILSHSERQGRSLTDMEDIESLEEILWQRNETITITDEYEVNALRMALEDPHGPVLKGRVVCEAIWPTE